MCIYYLFTYDDIFVDWYTQMIDDDINIVNNRVEYSTINPLITKEVIDTWINELNKICDNKIEIYCIKTEYVGGKYIGSFWESLELHYNNSFVSGTGVTDSSIEDYILLKHYYNTFLDTLYYVNAIPKDSKYKAEHISINSGMYKYHWDIFNPPFHDFQFKVITTRMQQCAYNNIQKWLTENITNKYYMSGGIIGFENEDDMAFFMLYWN